MQQMDNLNSKERLLKLCEHEEGVHYTFHVPKGKGVDSVNAVRMAMSRMRAKAKRYGQLLPPFKIYVWSVEEIGGCDRVTLYRAQAAKLSKAVADYQIKC